MPGTNVAIGPDAKVTINATAFACVSGTYSEEGDVVPVNDTESGAYKKDKVGLLQISVDLEIQRSSDVSPHTAPLAIYPGSRLPDVKFYPHGVAGVLYTIPILVVTQWTHNFQVQGSAAQTFRFRGQSYGAYTRTA